MPTLNFFVINKSKLNKISDLRVYCLMVKNRKKLMWQKVASSICHYVGIASNIFVVHTFREMNNKFIITLTLLVLLIVQWPAITAEPDNRLKLVSEVATWVAKELSVGKEQVEVLALDRRLKIPNCNSPFSISFPYTSATNNVRVKCEESGWFAYIGLKIHMEIKALAYKSDFSAGSIITFDDLKPIKIIKNSKKLTSKSTFSNNMVLNIDVSEGQLAEERHLSMGQIVYKSQIDIKKGEKINQAIVEKYIKASTLVGKNQIFIDQTIFNAIAARDIPKNTTIDASHLKFKNEVLVATKTIPLGHKINSLNASTTEYYGQLASGTLMNLKEAENMETIRTIKTGEPIRLAHIKVAFMVKKGDEVILEIETGPLTVTSTMIALENGRFNDQVNLMNSESEEIVRATVIGPGKTKGI